LNYLPSTGAIGEERKELMVKLKQYHDKAWEVRGVISESLMRERLLKAESAPVRSWRAKKVGFNLSFAQLQSTIQQEFSQTGATKKVSESINAAWNTVYTAYYDQEQNVKAEYQQAMQNPPVSENRNDAAYEAFLQQLGAYKSIDNQLYSELISRVSAFVGTLQQQKQMALEVLYSLKSQLVKLQQDHLIAVINEGQKIISNYCSGDECNLPAPHYVGLLQMKFPQPDFEEKNSNINDFISPLLNYISALDRKTVNPGRLVTFPDGKKKYIDQLIEVPNIDILSDDKLVQLELYITSYRTILEELQSKIADFSGPPPLSTDALIAFLKRITVLQKQLKDLAASARNQQQNYRTTLENVEKDQNYLTQLSSVLYSLNPVLSGFRERYAMIRVPSSSHDSHFFFNPDLIATPGSYPSCDLIDYRPTLMTPKEVKPALKELQMQLEESRFTWLDQKYQLGLGSFIDSFIRKSTRLMSVQDPGHYQFISDGSSCRLLHDEDFNRLAEAIGRIEDITEQFPLELRSLIGSSPAYWLLGLPYVNQYNYITILDELPVDHLDILKQSVKKSWDPKMAASMQKVIDVFTNKLQAYREWQAKEVYFKEKFSQFEKLSGQFSNHEYQAGAANMAMKSDAELIPLYEKAVAMEAPIANFLGAAAVDPKLSSSRQHYFSGQQPGYEKRFYFLKEMLRNLKQSANNLKKEGEQAVNEEKIRSFYEVFQQAYAEKNESRLLSYLSDDWEAGDGTTLYDVEDYFHNMFNVFDEIQMQISGLNFEPIDDGRYRVSYETSIIGRIFDDGLEHEEKSSVTEEVVLDPSGKVKISRTPQGRFWYVK